MSKVAISKYTMIILLFGIMLISYGCTEGLIALKTTRLIYETNKIATGSTSLKAVGEIPKAESYDAVFKQLSTAGVNGGLTIISSNKEIGSLSMEKIQYDQIMRFSVLVKENDNKYIVDLTQDYKKHSSKETLLRNAIAIFANLQEVSSYKPEDMSITIEEKTLTLNDWMKEVFEKK